MSAGTRIREKLPPDEEERLQEAADELIAAYGGDIMAALKVTMIHGGNLEAALEEISDAYPGLIDISQIQ